jgi:AcrR family transcriptional regulator
MREAGLTSQRILVAAEDVLRRHGPAKATVVDVARALHVSHGAVYRHFPSKSALREAVTERWLARISGPLAEIASEETGARSSAAMARAAVRDLCGARGGVT